MGRYLKTANHHLERIEYFLKHAGSAGYNQAQYHYSEILELMQRASKSKNNQSDATVIHLMLPRADEMMAKMRIARDAPHSDSGSEPIPQDR